GPATSPSPSRICASGAEPVSWSPTWGASTPSPDSRARRRLSPSAWTPREGPSGCSEPAVGRGDGPPLDGGAELWQIRLPVDLVFGLIIESLPLPPSEAKAADSLGGGAREEVIVMSQVKKSWSAAVLAVLGLTVSACSCEGDGGQRLAPQFALEGPTVGPDSRGEADFEGGFGTIPVGSRHVPEVTLVNKGNTTLTVRLASDQIEAPFSLASGTFELRPKTSRPIEFSLAPDTDGDFVTIVEFDTNEPGRGKRRVRLVGSATQSRFVCDPVELDLGHVVVGEFRTGTVSCTNHLDIPTTISLGDFIGAYSAYFRAEIQGLGDGRTAEIPAGATVSIEVRFTADGINGIATATLPLIDPSGQIVQSIH